MSRAQPAEACQELGLAPPLRLSDAAELALEDYARTLARAEAAEAWRAADDPALVAGIHLCRPELPPGASAARDIEDFARDLAVREGRSGLGWS